MSRIKSSSVKYGSSFVVGGNETNSNNNFNSKEELQASKKQLEVDIDNLIQERKILEKEKESLITDAIEKAQEILDNANTQAEKIKSVATEEAEELKKLTYEQAVKKGKEEGFKEGLSKGFDDIKAKTDKQILALTTLVEASFEMKKEIVFSAEQDVLDLAFLIAKKLTKTELTQNTEVITNIIKAALSSLKEKEEVKILINPQIAEVVYSISDDLKNCIKGLEQIKIIEDKTIPSDGVIVESIDSRVDARLSTQLDEIMKSIKKEKENSAVLNEIPEEIEKEIKKKQTAKITKKSESKKPEIKNDD